MDESIEDRRKALGNLKGENLLKLLSIHPEFAKRMSTKFLDQLHHGLIYGSVHPDCVITQINCLERNQPSVTEAEREFRGSILKRFWYKHYYQANHIPLNLKNETKLGILRSKKFFEEYRKATRGTNDPRVVASRIAHAMTMVAWENRTKKQKVTGERIVFAKWEGANYYLTLSWHIESDEVVMNRLKESILDFPFLEPLFI